MCIYKSFLVNGGRRNSASDHRLRNSTPADALHLRVFPIFFSLPLSKLTFLFFASLLLCFFLNAESNNIFLSSFVSSPSIYGAHEHRLRPKLGVVVVAGRMETASSVRKEQDLCLRLFFQAHLSRRRIGQQIFYCDN